MNVRDGKLYCLGEEIEHNNIIAYDTNHIGCLYLTDDGRIHYVGDMVSVLGL